MNEAILEAAHTHYANPSLASAGSSRPPMMVTRALPASVSYAPPMPMQVAAPSSPAPEHQAFNNDPSPFNSVEASKKGTMEISRFQDGKPVFRWKSNSTSEPTLSEKMMGEDMFIGMAAGGTIGLALKLTGVIAVGAGSLPAVATMIGITAVSAAIGGYFNKQRVEDQMKNGIEFEPATELNRGTAHGMMQGMVSGAGMTIFAGTIIKKATAALGIESLSHAASAMAPTLASGTIGLAALSSFAIPALVAVGVGLYIAHKRSKEHEEAAESRYEQARQIYEVQHGISRTQAPVKELEDNITKTINRNYKPEAAKVGLTVVGAAALHALADMTSHSEVAHDAVNITSKIASNLHAPTHMAAEAAHEASIHSQMHAMHAAKPENEERTKSFVQRYVGNRSEAPLSYAERVSSQQEQSPTHIVR
jgi:hypothetical protein